MQRIDNCNEIRLALLPPAIATCPHTVFLLTVLTNSCLVVTTQHIYFRGLIRSIAYQTMIQVPASSSALTPLQIASNHLFLSVDAKVEETGVESRV
jgi:hypothetical protein